MSRGKQSPAILAFQTQLLPTKVRWATFRSKIEHGGEIFTSINLSRSSTTAPMSPYELPKWLKSSIAIHDWQFKLMENRTCSFLQPNYRAKLSLSEADYTSPQTSATIHAARLKISISPTIGGCHTTAGSGSSCNIEPTTG